MQRQYFYLLSLIIYVFITSCTGSDHKSGEYHVLSENFEVNFQKMLIEAKAGDTFILPEGNFDLKRSISLNDTPDITIKGSGKRKTVLSFKNQIQGAEGMLIKNVKGINLEGFTIVDSKGDAVKVQDCENVIMRDLEATWTTGKSSENGAYGLYPVSSMNVLIENCEASYAMDAGLYVGQSTNVVVRDNYVHNNVAGLEIENTINGEVYRNTAKNNTGGMLIFDMPDLPQANGDRIVFYDNLMEDNNGENFAPKGMVVSTIPPGSGMILMSHSNIEAYNNRIIGHNTIGIAVNSWLFTGIPFESEEFDPFMSGLYLHDNIIETGKGPTDSSTEYGQFISAILQNNPVDIITDGIFKPSSLDQNGTPQDICIHNNGEISFVNLNMSKGDEPMQILQNLSRDKSMFDCTLPSIDTEEHDSWLAEK